MMKKGFVTGRTIGEVQNVTEDEVVNVFLPTTPNPTSGYLLFLPRHELVVLSMTVEEAIKMIISGGIVTPEDLRPAEQQQIKLVSLDCATGKVQCADCHRVAHAGYDLAVCGVLLFLAWRFCSVHEQVFGAIKTHALGVGLMGGLDVFR